MKDENRKQNGTHYAVSEGVSVGTQLGVDVGQEPGERPAAQTGTQGLPLRDVPDVYARVLQRGNTNRHAVVERNVYCR